jgi:hypothetical protein
MKKIFFFVVFLVGCQNLTLASTSFAINDLKTQEKKLLEIWQQQQLFIGQVLFHLKNQQTYSSSTTYLSTRNIASLIHRELLLRNFNHLLKKQQEQVVKLCQDIIQTRQYIKSLFRK